MPADKTLSQKYQEMIEVLRELTDSLARLEERLEFFSTNLSKLDEKLDRHELAFGHEGLTMEINKLKLRLESLETTFRDFPHSEVVKQIHAIRTELTPYNQFLEEIKGLPEKVRNLEKEEATVRSRWKTFYIMSITFLVNLIWVIIASYVLVKFGLQMP